MVALAAVARPAPPAGDGPRAKTVQRAQLIAAMEQAIADGSFRATAADRVPEQRAESPGGHRGLRKLTPRSRLSRRLAVGGLTMGVAAGAFGGVAAASTNALPGDSLYGLKRGMEDLKLDMAGSDASRGQGLPRHGLHPDAGGPPADGPRPRRHARRRVGRRGAQGAVRHAPGGGRGAPAAQRGVPEGRLAPADGDAATPSPSRTARAGPTCAASCPASSPTSPTRSPRLRRHRRRRSRRSSLPQHDGAALPHGAAAAPATAPRAPRRRPVRRRPVRHGVGRRPVRPGRRAQPGARAVRHRARRPDRRLRQPARPEPAHPERPRLDPGRAPPPRPATRSVLPPLLPGLLRPRPRLGRDGPLASRATGPRACRVPPGKRPTPLRSRPLPYLPASRAAGVRPGRE